MKQKKGSKFGILIAVLLIILFGVMAAVMTVNFSIQRERSRAEEAALAAEAWALYNRIMERDLVSDYPQTPEAVMDFFNWTAFYIYGRPAKDPDDIRRVLFRQRELFTDELLLLNPFEPTLAHLLESMEELHARQIFATDINRSTAYFYDLNNDHVAVIRSTIYLTGSPGSFDRDFYFVWVAPPGGAAGHGRWKIEGWRENVG